MTWLLDTSVAIAVRDADARYRSRIDGLGADVSISVISRVELEGGVHREPENVSARRARLDLFLSNVDVWAFDDLSAEAYRAILEACGFSRRKILDRMIAAQAIVYGATLVTLNPADFADIPGLKLLAW